MSLYTVTEQMKERCAGKRSRLSEHVCACLWCMQDLAKDRAAHYKKARRFFDGIALHLVQQQHSLDVFACALDQACPLPLTRFSSLIDDGSVPVLHTVGPLLVPFILAL